MKYKELTSDKCQVQFYGEIGNWMNNGKEFTDLFDQLQAKYRFIDIRVHCYGGSVFEGNVIYNAIKNCTAEVTIYIDGVAASMMSIVMLAAKKIYIASNAFVMIHPPSASTSGQAKDHFATAKVLKSLEQNFSKDYKAKTGKSDSDIASMMDGADNWFSAEECLAIKLVDGITDAVDTSAGAVYKPDQSGQEAIMFNRFAALALPTITQPQKSTLMKELLIAMFALQGVTKDSSDTAVAEAIKANFDAAKTLSASLQTKLTEFENGQTEMLIAAAETANGKPFEAAVKTSLTDIAKVSMAAFKMALTFATVPVQAAAATVLPVATTPAPAAAPNALNFIAGGKGNTAISAERAAWKWSDWCEKDEAGLKALSEELQGAIYKASYGVDMPK